jgi:hypothetical protein
MLLAVSAVVRMGNTAVVNTVACWSISRRTRRGSWDELAEGIMSMTASNGDPSHTRGLSFFRNDAMRRIVLGRSDEALIIDGAWFFLEAVASFDRSI